MKKIEVISILEFGGRTMDWTEIDISITPYLEEEYLCACGNTHIINTVEDGLIRQLTENRIVLRNLECKTVTCLQIDENGKLLPKTVAKVIKKHP